MAAPIRCTRRACRRVKGEATAQAIDEDRHREQEQREAAPRRIVDAAEHVVGVLPDAGDEDHGAMRRDEAHEPAERDEMDRAHRLPVEHPADPAERIGDCRALQQAGQDRDGRRDEDGYEVTELLQAVVAGPALVDRKVERGILEGGGERGRKHFPGQRHQPLPLVGREQQHIEDDAVEQPEQVDGKMPPAREPEGVAQAGYAEPGRQGLTESSLAVHSRPLGTGT